MSDGEFQVEVKNRGSKSTIPVIFEQEEIDLDVYLHLRQLEESYIYEQLIFDGI